MVLSLGWVEDPVVMWYFRVEGLVGFPWTHTSMHTLIMHGCTLRAYGGSKAFRLRH